MNVKSILGEKPFLSSTNFKQKRLSLPDDTAQALHRYKMEWKHQTISIALDHLLRRVLLQGALSEGTYLSNDEIRINKPIK